ncbi:MAG: DUF4358 domain-containing protein [Propionibacteriaceae bacterium]|jgi:hypothetical protein|nr:DUF4358 domain-containing protein [Propionibacteriaceae bacterium]
MKKILITIMAALAVAVSLVACSGGADDTKLSGSTDTILTNLLTTAKIEIAMPEQAPATEDNASGTLGISAEQFKSYVVEATVSSSLMMTSAHQVTLAKTKTAADATELAKLIAAEFDSTKWVCVMPDRSVVVTSGTYVLLVVSTNEYVDAVLKAFEDAAGTTANLNTFYTKS